MNNEEIFEYMRENPINLLFRDKENKINFINYIEVFHSSNINTCSRESYINYRHITYYYEANKENFNDILMYGSLIRMGKEDIYYEDLLSYMTVELLWGEKYEQRRNF